MAFTCSGFAITTRATNGDSRLTIADVFPVASSTTSSIRLRLDFAADFADIFEARGSERARRGTAHPAALEADAVTLTYTCDCGCSVFRIKCNRVLIRALD